MINKIEDSVILKHDAQVPRYTSYPTAPHFNSDVNGEVVFTWLKTLPENETISLYIHIPFCDQLCWYCGCYTKVTSRYAPVEDYAHIVARELRLVADLLDKKITKFLTFILVVVRQQFCFPTLLNI